MGTPFISVSYEQKMSGFMNISGLNDYCIPIGELTGDKLVNAFDKLCENYDSYKVLLDQKKQEWSQMAHRTTDAVFEFLGER
jgi:colanic acid/amylovoran biosynthesis protein